MNNIAIFILKSLRWGYRKMFLPTAPPYNPGIKDPDEASEVIYDLLTSGKPCMIARFGAFELATIVNYLGVSSSQHSIWKYIKGKQPQWWWNKSLLKHMQSNAGFFPATEENVERYCKLMFEDLQYLDVLESWLPQESLLESKLTHCQRVTAKIMAPFFLDNPWTRILKGKNVLVVHPFAKSIESQYMKRSLLFNNPEVLPEFHLETVKAVQSIGGACDYNNWFDALKYMKKKIDKHNYDICIIGCGAYGFNLAAHVKRMGKQAVHLAGMTQLLFGIKGTRWEQSNYSTYNYLDLFNEHWVRPQGDEIPSLSMEVENNCYW